MTSINWDKVLNKTNEKKQLLFDSLTSKGIKKEDINQTVLAKELGISRVTLNRWLKDFNE